MTGEDDQEAALRATLLSAILAGIARRGRPLTEISEVTGLPDIIVEEIASRRQRGVVDRVALWPLLRAVAALGHDVTITLAPARGSQGRITVTRTEGERP